MDARVRKLHLRGVPLEDAEELVKAGLDTPAKIRSAGKLPIDIKKWSKQTKQKLGIK